MNPIIPWDPEEFYFTSRKDQPVCAIPKCGHPTKHRGLCGACYQTWKRDGMAGLGRRMARLAKGIERIHASKLTPEQLENKLFDAFEQVVDTDSEDDAEFQRRRNHFLYLCRIYGSLEERKREKSYAGRTKESYIERYGLEAWQERLRKASRRYRAQSKLNKATAAPTKGVDGTHGEEDITPIDGGSSHGQGHSISETVDG